MSLKAQEMAGKAGADGLWIEGCEPMPGRERKNQWADLVHETVWLRLRSAEHIAALGAPYRSQNGTGNIDGILEIIEGTDEVPAANAMKVSYKKRQVKTAFGGVSTVTSYHTIGRDPVPINFTVAVNILDRFNILIEEVPEPTKVDGDSASALRKRLAELESKSTSDSSDEVGPPKKRKKR